jgi:hypothetical protein
MAAHVADGYRLDCTYAYVWLQSLYSLRVIKHTGKDGDAMLTLTQSPNPDPNPNLNPNPNPKP